MEPAQATFKSHIGKGKVVVTFKPQSLHIQDEPNHSEVDAEYCKIKTLSIEPVLPAGCVKVWIAGKIHITRNGKTKRRPGHLLVLDEVSLSDISQLFESNSPLRNSAHKSEDSLKYG